MLLFLFSPFHFWDATSPLCQWKNTYCTSSLSVALDHSESGLGSYVVEGYKCVTHQRAPDSAWQSSTLGAHISSQRLKLDWRWPWPSLFPRAQKKNLSCGRHTLRYYHQSFPQLSLTCTESIKCLWPHVPEVAFRLLFVTLSCQMPLSTFPIPCVYVTEVVKQKCNERCRPWLLTP